MVQKLGLGLMLLALLGCSESVTKVTARRDGGAPDRGASDGAIDAGPSGPLVLNVGAACAEEQDCQGPAATCQMTLGIPAAPTGPGASPQNALPGGYCTASCTTQEQCGEDGGCAVKELIDTLAPLAMLAGIDISGFDLGQIPSQCLKRCSRQGDCRDGYVCENLSDATGIGEQLMLPPLLTLQLSRYCLPAPSPLMPESDGGRPVLDSGVPESDAGGPALDGGASESDGGAQD